ncbi:hypothetical protein GCM10017783_17550 [Deinococcus piscis]|uniref:Uncharacterized protein n=1 Tax=Deinococcus piscis TaxID=394230 RepID=A0ABQ3K8E7_9DEIO|nr:hypothetical protein [Deinococcus piscis]GHG05463.1 hypothetical protein GCM10017783_17550 [Deinococcus piscis]
MTDAGLRTISQPEDIYQLNVRQAAALLEAAERSTDEEWPQALHALADAAGVSPDSDPAAVRQGLDLLRIREMIGSLNGQEQRA